MSSAAGATGATRKKPLNVVLKELLKKLRRKDRSHLFWEAVPRTVPGYYEAISQPMDFALMESKMKKVKYATLDDFKADYLLIVHNCKFFNNSASEYWAQADMMEKYGLEVIELARDTVDSSLPPSAKFKEDDAAKAPLAVPAAAMGSAAIKQPTPSTAQKAAAASTAVSFQPVVAKPGSRAAQIAQSTTLFEQVTGQSPSVFNGSLYPGIPPTLLAAGFVHPASLPESSSYWSPSPYSAHHPLSGIGQAQAQALLNATSASHLTKGSKHRNQYTKSLPQTRLGATKRDLRAVTGPGVENNFGMAASSTATNMDWCTVWAREQEVWRHTGKSALFREEQDSFNGLGPLSYADYKPANLHMPFDTRYLDRIQRFVKGGLLGDAAAIHQNAAAPALHMAGSAAAGASGHLSGGSSGSTSVYTHLLSDSGVHKALAAKVDAIVADTTLSLKAGPKDFQPTPLCVALPKAHPVQLKTGEPMGISLADVHNIRSLMAELEQRMKQAFALKQQQLAAKAQPPMPEATAAADAPAAAAATPVPMDIDVKDEAKGEVKSEVAVKSEPATEVKQAEVKSEPVLVKQEPNSATTADTITVKVEGADAAPAVAVAPPAAPARPTWVAPNPLSSLPDLPMSRIVVLDVQLVNLVSGSCDACVRFRFAPPPSPPSTPVDNFTPEFLASCLTQADVHALKGMLSVGERMVDWHRIKQDMMRAQQQQMAMRQQQHLQQQQAKAQQQQQQQQAMQNDAAKAQQMATQQAKLQAQAKVQAQQSSLAAQKHYASPLPPADEQAMKRAKLDAGSSSHQLSPQQHQQQLLIQQHKAMLQHQQQKQQQQPQQQQQQHAHQQPPQHQQQPPAHRVGAPMLSQSPSSGSGSMPSSSLPSANAGPSSSPQFDRSRLFPALRNLSSAILDRFIAMGFISPVGAVLVDTATIIAKLREIQQQQQQQQQQHQQSQQPKTVPTPMGQPLAPAPLPQPSQLQPPAQQHAPAPMPSLANQYAAQLIAAQKLQQQQQQQMPPRQ